MPQKHNYHSSDYEQVVELFQSSQSGLGSREAYDRLSIYGLNHLVEKRRPTILSIFFSQFKDIMTIILLSATLISGFLGEYADAATIMAIVLLNAVLGLMQELKAERALAALKELAAPMVTVKRDGLEQVLKAELVVPGDIVLFSAGDRVPADIRLGLVSALEIDEAALTGESLPVRKTSKAVAAESSLPERRSMAYYGTIITKGHATGVVVATGMETEVGRIADLLQMEDDEPTPLQARLAQLGRYLVAVCLLVCAGVVALGVLRGEAIHRMFLAGVSLAVAAIPEGLPAIVTIVLALGVQRISKVQALVRRLPAVETLGSATVICSDKTGTLTCNQMTVRQVYVGEQEYRVTGDGLSLRGQFLRGSSVQQSPVDQQLQLALRIGAACNNSKLAKGKTTTVIGDPTEGALLVAAEKAKVIVTDTRVGEIPFDSNRKMMSVVVSDPAHKHWVFVKGAPDILLGKCSHILCGGLRSRITEQAQDRVITKNEAYAARGIRVLGLAFREFTGGDMESAQNIEKGLTFVGLIAMQDPPRSEVREALNLCQLAGIRVIMVTGDHALTALSIAKEIGLAGSDARAILGSEIDALSDKGLWDAVNSCNVFARVSPENKLRIVRTLRKQGHVVAMTGDGINDAPALKEADIGISMGLCGTEVAREASSLVLQDDNFASIVDAVREGRGIYDNIRKFIRYLLACNVGELLSVFVAMACGLPLPLRPMQILWINLVTDGLPAMALGVDSADTQIMLRRPRPRQEGIFSRGLGRKIVARGVLIGLSTVLVFAASLHIHGDLPRAQTMAFCTLVMCQLFHVFDCRSEVMGIAEKGLFTNRLLLGSVFISLFLVLVSIYVPFMRYLFDNTALDGMQWLTIVLASGLPTIVIGLRRAYLYRARR